jgi:hypothetical protein
MPRRGTAAVIARLAVGFFVTKKMDPSCLSEHRLANLFLKHPVQFSLSVKLNVAEKSYFGLFTFSPIVSRNLPMSSDNNRETTFQLKFPTRENSLSFCTNDFYSNNFCSNAIISSNL